MRILLIEDEPKVSALVKRGLTAERYAVDNTVDGREGLEYAEAYPYDLILLDLMLPTLSGLEVLQRIRRTNQYVPILVLTARDSVEDKVKLFESGADDYLTKPFAFAELLVRVKALLRRGPVNRSSTLRIGDLELDRPYAAGETARQAHRAHGEGVLVAGIPHAEPGSGTFTDDDHRARVGSELRWHHQHRGRVCTAPAQQDR